jgi:hypothetical protein
MLRLIPRLLAAVDGRENVMNKRTIHRAVVDRIRIGFLGIMLSTFAHNEGKESLAGSED